MNNFYGYMSEWELQCAKESAMIESTLNRINKDFTVAEMDHRLRLEDIEMKALFNESATDNDLTNMYLKEHTVFMEETESLWQKFKNWLKGIINAILGKNKKIDPNSVDGDVEIPDVEGSINFIDKVLNNLKSLPKFKNSDGSYNVTGILTAGVIGSSVLGGGVAVAKNFEKIKEFFSKTIKVPFTKAAELFNKILEKLPHWQKDADEVIEQQNGDGGSSNDEKNSKKENGSKGGVVRNIVTGIINFAKQLIEKVRNILFKKDKKSDDSQNSENDKKDNESTEGNTSDNKNDENSHKDNNTSNKDNSSSNGKSGNKDNSGSKKDNESTTSKSLTMESPYDDCDEFDVDEFLESDNDSLNNFINLVNSL